MCRWQKEALYLMARVCDSSDVLSCLDEREVWRGAVLIREKKVPPLSPLHR